MKLFVIGKADQPRDDSRDVRPGRAQTPIQDAIWIASESQCPRLVSIIYDKLIKVVARRWT